LLCLVQARVSDLETELDVLYGKLEALTYQHKTQQARDTPHI
jgi:hypothetical protein